MKRRYKVIAAFYTLGLFLCILLVVSLSSRSYSSKPRAEPASTPTPRSARNHPAIRAVMDYVPGKEETILNVIGVVIAASEQTGNDIEIEGWGAIPRGEDWEVQFCFVENGTRACAVFWHDPQKGTVAPKNYWGELYFNAAKAW